MSYLALDSVAAISDIECRISYSDTSCSSYLMKFYPGYSSKNELVSGRKFGDGYKAFQLARPACVELCKKRSDCKGFHYDNLRTQRLCLISLFSKARFKLKWAKLLTTHCTPKTWSFIFFFEFD